ncbi:MAG: hypothetical protein SVZ03_12400 [Spirochaetota bacterium]|nr:hypothetical protein [Spirochaetota bacterium]
MQELHNNIEKSTRKIFRIFFGSKLYKKKKWESLSNDLLGVDLYLNYNGNKRLYLYLEDETINSIMDSLLIDKDIQPSDKVASDIIREMACLITGNAVEDECEELRISTPSRFQNIKPINENTLNFSSKLGNLSIGIEDI